MLKLTSGLACFLLPKCSVQGMMQTFTITKLISACQHIWSENQFFFDNQSENQKPVDTAS